jgi:ESCRT-II complex subunit VPS22
LLVPETANSTFSEENRNKKAHPHKKKKLTNRHQHTNMYKNKVGRAGLIEQQKLKQKFKEKGVDVSNMQMSHMQERLKFFRESLEDFARKHKKDINNDPQLRNQFQKMCSKIGVDPLASQKGFWTEMLGVGDFYYELAIQIIEVCIKTRDENGGIIELNELTKKLTRMRSRHSRAKNTKALEITNEDVKRSLNNMKELGNGYKLLLVGGKYYIQSVPCELSNDHTELLAAVNRMEKIGVSIDELSKELGWNRNRTEEAMVR